MVTVRNHDLTTDAGAIVAWGLDAFGEGSPPPDNTDFEAVAAGRYYSLGLKSDGTIVAWGLSYFGGDVVPDPNGDWEAIAAFDEQSVGLKSDGTLVAWGQDNAGQLEVPAPDPDFVDILAGHGFGIALRADGTAACWGDWFTIPEADNHDLVTVDALDFFTVAALRDDGSLVIWNTDPTHAEIPGPNEGFTAVSAGQRGVAAVRGDVITAINSPLPDLRAATLDLTAAPNPFNPQVVITVRSQLAAEVTLEVLDVRGRRVRVLWRGSLAGGTAYTTIWDGRDDRGLAVPSSTYLIQARTDDSRWTVNKVSLVR